ncbi:hypothetical protein RIF29_23137 [Crotalaria pallida]|uniref:SKP1 component POZ domain-containing protein n=1 Tax=Crotalaria pallida TaxID=3830 RepID=A0AAN9F5S6_CROPI
MEIDDPLFTPIGIDLWDLMDRLMLEDPEYAKVLVLPKDDGRFDDVEENMELKEVSAEAGDYHLCLDYITLQTLQGDLFEVDEAFVNECKKIKPLIDGRFTKKVTLSLQIKSETLSKVIEYVNKHAEFGATANKAHKKNLKAWDAEFMKVDMDSLYDLITFVSYESYVIYHDSIRNQELRTKSYCRKSVLYLGFGFELRNKVSSCDSERLRQRAASNLGHESLLNLVCQTVAEKIKGNDQHMLRKMFNIKNDFTPEQEEEDQKMFDSMFCP